MGNLNVLFEDNHIIIVVKPIGILSQSDSSHDPDLLTEVKKYVKTKYNKPGNVYVGLIHRLDRNVGGVMVFAKTSKAANRLNSQITEKRFKKKYVAVVEGRVENNSGELKHFLIKDKHTNTALVFNKLSDAPKSIGEEKPKESILRYRVIKRVGDKSLLDIDLLTGRFHQIRAQLAHIGHPIVGDLKYNNKNNAIVISKKVFPYLWAYKLTIYHPVSNEKLDYVSNPTDGDWPKYIGNGNF